MFLYMFCFFVKWQFKIEIFNTELTIVSLRGIIDKIKVVKGILSQSVNGEHNMSVSYKKLWKLLIDRDMMKKDLRERAGLTTNVIAKMGKEENVSTEVLCKICAALDCGLEDIIEIIPDGGKADGER